MAYAVRIQYGGSVAPDNVDALMACPGASTAYAMCPRSCPASRSTSKVQEARSHARVACAYIDGALVGGASLVADKFYKIINFK